MIRHAAALRAGILGMNQSSGWRDLVTADDLRAFLTQRGVRFAEKPIPYATQFRCQTGEIFNVYDSGKVSFGGKTTTELARAVHSWDQPSSDPDDSDDASEPRRAAGVDNRVFVVYGHDTTARDGLELLLHKMGMEPIVLANLPAGGDTIIEKLEHFLGKDGQIGFACVLLTPDDQGHAVAEPAASQYRARQNVVLELGMVLARLGRPRVAILHKQSVELPSDINGLLYLAFKEHVAEARNQLFQELVNAGYRPNPAGLR